MIIIFWLSILIIFYTFIGYGLLLFLLVSLKRTFKRKKRGPEKAAPPPSLTVVVAAYNEEDIIEQKISNTLSLDYPEDKISYLFVTDGATDNTPAIVARYQQIRLLHQQARGGKIQAIHRAMEHVNTEIVVFTDANTFLNKKALLNIARHYSDDKIGAVAGEKRVQVAEHADATAGEGFYWKYESALKKWDSELYSVVGAAGELFSIRTSLYQPVPKNTILDDFMISLLVAQKGYKIVYEPEAFAVETASANTKEELKRKIRIAAGGIQSVVWLRRLLNPVHYPLLSFQYISHRVLRWTVTPICLLLAFSSNISILTTSSSPIFWLLFYAQAIFYLAAVIGWVFERREIKSKAFFIPYYFCLMNYAVLAGMNRYLFGKQSAAWEKAKRK